MITYTGTFKVIQQIVEWINGFTPSSSAVETKTYVDISGNTVNALYQITEVEDE